MLVDPSNLHREIDSTEVGGLIAIIIDSIPTDWLWLDENKIPDSLKEFITQALLSEMNTGQHFTIVQVIDTTYDQMLEFYITLETLDGSYRTGSSIIKRNKRFIIEHVQQLVIARLR